MSNLKTYFYIFERYNKLFSKGYVVSWGRNFFGRITVQHKGGGLKNKYRKIDFNRNLNQYGFILRICVDHYRSGYIGLIFYESGLINLFY